MNVRLFSPDISVVIPTFNRAHRLVRCLDSLVEQEFKNFEVLICDDGSTDNTQEVISGYKHLLDITYTYGANFGGPARARNRGISLARAPLVAFLDSDDWWTSNKLSVVLKAFDCGADIVSHDLYVVTRGDQFIYSGRLTGRQLRDPAFEDLLSRGNGLLNSSVVVKRSLLLEIGGISEDKDLIASEDYDTWLRISRITSNFKHVRSTLGYYWKGGGNISNEGTYIRNLRRIQSIYAKDFERLSEKYNFFWINYPIGIDYLKRNDHESAARALRLICFRRSPIAIYLKSRIVLFFLALRKRFASLSS